MLYLIPAGIIALMGLYIYFRFFFRIPTRGIHIYAHGERYCARDVFLNFHTSDALFFLYGSEIESIEQIHDDHYKVHCADGTVRDITGKSICIDVVDHEAFYDPYGDRDEDPELEDPYTIDMEQSRNLVIDLNGRIRRK